MEMEIRAKAIDAAKNFAEDIDDLIIKASKLEKFIIGDVNSQNEISNEKTFDETALLHNAMMWADRGSTIADPYSDPLVLEGPADSWYTQYKNIVNENKDIPTDDIVPEIDIKQIYSMANYVVKDIATGKPAKLSPLQLLLGQLMNHHNIVINTCRQAYTTTALAAFALEKITEKENVKILMLTSHKDGCDHLQKLTKYQNIDIMTFKMFHEITTNDIKYDFIIIDRMADIPYSFEFFIKEKIEDRSKPDTRFVMCSNPAYEKGWFYELYTDQSSDFYKIAIDWVLAGRTSEWTNDERKTLGIKFPYLYENQFMPVE